MVGIVLVCVAAVSGTFLARRMRAQLPDVEIAVSTLESLPENIGPASIVLVAPQLAGNLDHIRALAGDRMVLELGAEDYSPAGADPVSERVRTALTTITARSSE